MNTKNRNFIILIFIMIINLIPLKVFAKEVVKTCRYEGGDENKYGIVFEIYDDDTKPHTTYTVWGEDIENWGSDKYSFDAKKYWEQTRRCPLYIIDVGALDVTFVFSDQKHKSEFLSDEDHIFENDAYILLSSDPEDKYIKGDSYGCEYDKFSIEFNSSGYAIDLTYPGENKVSLGDQFSWYLDESLTENAYSPGVCPNVNYCYISHASDPNSGAEIEQYTVGSDSMALDNADECIVKDHINNFLICKDGENCNGSVEVCGTYTDLLNEVKEKYNCVKNDENCIYDSTSEDKLKSLCNSILSYLDYDNSCLKKCLNLSDDIDKIKNKDNNNNIVCGFSEKLILYIANIIKWVKYIIPVIVIVLGILDFIKAIASEKDDEMKKAQGSFVKRLIAAAIIFIVPFIIEFILDKMGFDANGCGIIDL